MILNFNKFSSICRNLAQKKHPFQPGLGQDIAELKDIIIFLFVSITLLCIKTVLK